MPKNFTSHALWPVGIHDTCDNHTTDKHNTREEAEGVCRLFQREGQLQEDGTRVIPDRAYVTEDKPDDSREYSSQHPMIKDGMNVMDCIVELSQGNPGAATALAAVAEQCTKHVTGIVLWLDRLEISGSAIYVLWSDKCMRNTKLFAGIIMGAQSGLLVPAEIKAMSEDQAGLIAFTGLPLHVAKVIAEIELGMTPDDGGL